MKLRQLVPLTALDRIALAVVDTESRVVARATYSRWLAADVLCKSLQERGRNTGPRKVRKGKSGELEKKSRRK